MKERPIRTRSTPIPYGQIYFQKSKDKTDDSRPDNDQERPDKYGTSTGFRPGGRTPVSLTGAFPGVGYQRRTNETKADADKNACNYVSRDYPDTKADQNASRDEEMSSAPQAVFLLFHC